MKFKQNKGFCDIFRIYAIPLILLVFILLSLPILQISGEEDDGSIIAENYKLSEEALNRLGNVSSYFNSIDTSSEKVISLKVSDVIIIYRKQLLEIPAHEDANTRILSGEIDALEEKGKAAGRLAWIYYYNIPTISNDQSVKIIDEKYTAYLAEIRGESDAAVISARADEICYEMNRAIYSEKIKNLSLESDSIDSSGLIEGTLSSIQSSTDKSLFATELSQVF